MIVELSASNLVQVASGVCAGTDQKGASQLRVCLADLLLTER